LLYHLHIIVIYINYFFIYLTFISIRLSFPPNYFILFRGIDCFYFIPWHWLFYITGSQLTFDGTTLIINITTFTTYTFTHNIHFTFTFTHFLLVLYFFCRIFPRGAQQVDSPPLLHLLNARNAWMVSGSTVALHRLQEQSLFYLFFV
jgi:hypothetical protein